MAAMKSKCPKGKIYVRGYKTKASRKRASHRVKGHCTKDTGKRGRTPKSKRVLPKLRKGALGTYHTNKSKTKRMAILARLVSKKSYSKVLKTLVVLRTYTRRSDPKHSRIYSSDIKSLQKWHKSHMKKSTKKRPSKKRRVTRKKRTLKRKTTKKRRTTKLRTTKKRTTKRRTTKKRTTKRRTTKKRTTKRRVVRRRRSSVMNK